MKRYFLSTAFFAFILFVIWEANHASSSTNFFFEFTQIIPQKDKIGHFILYGVLALLLDKAFREKNYRIFKTAIPVSFVWVMAFATVEEFSQIWIPVRNFDLIDLGADLIGVLLFIAASRLIEVKIKKVDFSFYKPTKKIREDQE